MKLQEARKLAIDLIHKFGLSDWNFKFDRSVNRFGYCRYRTKTISLSRYLTRTNDREHIEDVIRHEISHALVGPNHGHGQHWKKMAINCGAKPERCYDSTIVKPIERLWFGTCPKCGYKIKRHRRRQIACRTCCNGQFNPKFLFVWTRIKDDSDE